MATDLGKVGIVMKGAYNSANTYEELDAVKYNTGTYIAKQAVPAGTTPTNTTYWQEALTPVGSVKTYALNPNQTTMFDAVAGMVIVIGRGSSAKGLYMLDFSSTLVELIAATGATISYYNGHVDIAVAGNAISATIISP